MKQNMNFAQISRTVLRLGLIICAVGAAAQAQITPTVCVDAPYRTGSATLAANAAIGGTSISVSGSVPPFVSLVINPGGANQETVGYVGINITGNNPYTLPLTNNFGTATYTLTKAHAAGERVTFAGYSGTAYFGYDNRGAARYAQVVIPDNFFQPGTPWRGQPDNFLPGINNNVISIPFGGQSSDFLTWTVLGQSVTASNAANNECAVITYQGRLSDAGAAAAGNYDLQFTLYDALTGGTSQSGTVTATNVLVAGGVFTVRLNFGSSLRGNNSAKFMEIAVKPSGNANDPFTVLTPRQPLTAVPFAVNAQKAFDVQMILTGGVPSTVNCDSASEYGQARVDATNLKLYICTAAGWKSATLQ